MDIHEITEWGRLDIDGAGPPSADDLTLAQQLRGQADELGNTGGSKLLLDWSHDGRLRVRARSWVGVVRVAGHEIRVMPKHTHGSLGVLTMLRYASGAMGNLLADHRVHCLADGPVQLMPSLACLHQVEHRGWPRQAADVGGKDPIRAAPHEATRAPGPPAVR